MDNKRKLGDKIQRTPSTVTQKANKNSPSNKKYCSQESDEQGSWEFLADCSCSKTAFQAESRFGNLYQPDHPLKKYKASGEDEDDEGEDDEDEDEEEYDDEDDEDDEEGDYEDDEKFEDLSIRKSSHYPLKDGINHSTKDDISKQAYQKIRPAKKK